MVPRLPVLPGGGSLELLLEAGDEAPRAELQDRALRLRSASVVRAGDVPRSSDYFPVVADFAGNDAGLLRAAWERAWRSAPCRRARPMCGRSHSAWRCLSRSPRR